MTRTNTTTPLAVAADYADALMTARWAGRVLGLLLFLIVASQLTIFLLARFQKLPLDHTQTVTVSLAASQPTTVPAEAASAVAAPAAAPADAPASSTSVDVADAVRYAIPLLNFAAVALGLVLVIVTLLLLTIMLVGRLIGVSHVTGAFIWAVLLVTLLVPWQTFLISDDSYKVAGASASISEQPAFKWPGATYTWAELHRDYKFENAPVLWSAVWGWGRYVAYPALTLLVLLLVLLKTRRGLRLALGEAEVHLELSTRTDTIAQ